MRSSGGCWRTLQGLTEFALLHSYLSTATKWGIGKLDALRRLFTGNAWLPPGLEPTWPEPLSKITGAPLTLAE
jgi:transposase